MFLFISINATDLLHSSGTFVPIMDSIKRLNGCVDVLCNDFVAVDMVLLKKLGEGASGQIML